MSGILENWQQWLIFFGAVLLAVCVALALHQLLLRILSGLAKRSPSRMDDMFVQHLRRPVRWVLIVLAVYLAVEPLDIPAGLDSFARHVFSIVLILLIVWLLIKAADVLNEAILFRFEISTKDNLRARTIYTQTNVLRRIVVAVIILIGLAAVLMTFERVRQLGTAILASAGIAGIVVGLAAQKTLGNIIAGLQIAFTQPIRIDDVVIVEGEWGRIEDITLTYVVVRIWDLRRLIVPITYLVEHPFQNWTRVTADILGTVMLYVDYTVPIDAIRIELQRILEDSKLWDRKVGLLQVTNTTDRAVELRALVSAADAGTCWDLRCLVREKLVEFIRQHYPRALPKVRAELQEPDDRYSQNA